MGCFKESVIALEKAAARQIRIYTDAADVGILIKCCGPAQRGSEYDSLRKQIKAAMLELAPVLEQHTKSENYHEWKYFVAWERNDGGRYTGIVIHVSWTRDVARRLEFITINITQAARAGALEV